MAALHIELFLTSYNIADVAHQQATNDNQPVFSPWDMGSEKIPRIIRIHWWRGEPLGTCS